MSEQELKELSPEELLEEFRAAVEELPGGGARARRYYFNVRQEILERMQIGLM